MKFVYVLTGDKKLYRDITLISALFLRRIHPNAEIILLTDKLSEQMIMKNPAASVFSDVISHKTPYANPHYASRFLRCSMRRIIKGDFLYLDSDTLPRKNLADIWGVEGSVAAVLNHNTGIFDASQEPEDGALKQFGWKLFEDRYLNAGVQFWRDTDETAELSAQWFSNWLMFSENKTHHDQIAFNAAMYSAKNLTLLGAEYNLQIKTCSDARLTETAKLWHYYMSDAGKPIMLISSYTELLEKEQTLPADFIDKELERITPICVPPGIPEKYVHKMLNEDNSRIHVREQKLTDLPQILSVRRIAIFGTGLSGSMTYDYLSGYKKDEDLLFIDDNRVEPFKGVKTITTDTFLKEMQSVCDLVVCGNRQKLNGRLSEELSIPLLRLSYIE